MGSEGKQRNAVLWTSWLLFFLPVEPTGSASPQLYGYLLAVGPLKRPLYTQRGRLWSPMAANPSIFFFLQQKTQLPATCGGDGPFTVLAVLRERVVDDRGSLGGSIGGRFADALAINERIGCG